MGVTITGPTPAGLRLHPRREPRTLRAPPLGRYRRAPRALPETWNPRRLTPPPRPPSTHQGLPRTTSFADRSHLTLRASLRSAEAATSAHTPRLEQEARHASRVR